MTMPTRKSPVEMAEWRIQDAIARALPNAIGAVPNESEGYDYPGGEGPDMERIINTLTEAVHGAIRATLPTSPGSVTSDPMAVERLRRLLSDGIDSAALDGEDGEGYAARVLSVETAVEAALGLLVSATFVHDVNSAGVPMRQVVAYGEWEMDPNPPKRGPMDIPTFAASPAPAWTVEKLHALWGQVYAATRRDWLNEQAARQELVARLRAAVFDVADRAGIDSPAHQSIRYALTGRGPGAPSELALAAVMRADEDAREQEAGCLPGVGCPECKPDVTADNRGELMPRRDDAVAAWLKSKRDEYEPGDPGYFTLDGVLDDYRLHADTGAPLSTPTDELGPHAPGEQ